MRRIIFYILMVFGIMTKVMAAAAVALLIIFAVYLSGIVRTFYTAPDISYRYREDMLSEESKEDNININNATVMLVDAINGDNGDGDSISGLFDVSDYDAVHEKAEQFMREFALHSKKITKIYVSPYGPLTLTTVQLSRSTLLKLSAEGRRRESTGTEMRITGSTITASSNILIITIPIIQAITDLYGE